MKRCGPIDLAERSTCRTDARGKRGKREEGRVGICPSARVGYRDARALPETLVNLKFKRRRAARPGRTVQDKRGGGRGLRGAGGVPYWSTRSSWLGGCETTRKRTGPEDGLRIWCLVPGRIRTPLPAAISLFSPLISIRTSPVRM